jgi:hypothetical protein
VVADPIPIIVIADDGVPAPDKRKGKGRKVKWGINLRGKIVTTANRIDAIVIEGYRICESTIKLLIGGMY